MGSRSGPLDPSDTEHAVMSFYPKEKYQYQDHALNAEPSSSRNSLSSNQRHSMSRAPNGLTRTESSRAKARSCSEPKQRPVQGTRRKNKPVESTKDLNFSLDGRRQSMSSNSLRFIYHGNEDHWVMNHYESSTDSKSGSFHGSTATSNSCYWNYIAPNKKQEIQLLRVKWHANIDKSMTSQENGYAQRTDYNNCILF